MVILKPLECMGGPRECGLKLLEEASELRFHRHGV